MDPREFGAKQILDPKNVRFQKNFMYKKFVIQKKFGQKHFWSKIKIRNKRKLVKKIRVKKEFL